MLESNSNKRLIVVDDEEMVISSIKNFLLLETDYEVLTFTSPKKALEELHKIPVSLAISDFLMSEMDGIEFLNEVRKLYSQATLILLTGYADKENAIKAINTLGIYKYIEKPWNNEELKITIDNAFERTDLILSLEKKVTELNEAQKELKKYTDKLEELVQERTKKLSYANAELEAIIESSADGILTLDDNLVITSANTAIENLKGLNKKNIVNQPLKEIIQFSNEFKDFNKPMKKIYPDRSSLICNNNTNRNIPVELSIAPILTSDFVTKHDYVVVVRDVTAQKETDRLREDFIATLTHDLRTPLLAAIQTLNFFLDGTVGELTDKQKKLLDTMRASNKDMLGLVNALLEVYKYESGELKLLKDYTNINELIKACLEEVQSLVEKKHLKIGLKLLEAPVQIYADKKELRRVLANLLGNAINFTPIEKEITIEAYTEKNYVTVKIKDAGRGIPTSDIGKLFQRFSQGTSKQRSTGTGLGLYLSRQIIEAHGGKIWVTSEENVGSTFGFSIPIKEIEANNEQ